MQQTYRYRNIIIKPHWMQFVINELHLLVLISVGFVYAGIDDAVLSTLVFVLSLLLSLCLAYRLAYMCRIDMSSAMNNWYMSMACFIGKWIIWNYTVWWISTKVKLSCSNYSD